MAIEQVLTEPTLLSMYTNIEQTFFVDCLNDPVEAIFAVTSMLIAAFLFYKPVTAFFSLFFLLTVAFILHRKKKQLDSELTATRKQLENVQTELQQLKSQKSSATVFQKSLNEAEITTRLQKPRLVIQNGDAVKTPDRYKYVQSLTEKGMSGEEIASILSISTHEADQLVKLSKLATMAA